MAFLAGKRILIMGLLSNRSIAYGIARSCHAQGAELAFTYQNDRFKGRVTEMAAEFGSSLVIPCDVAEDAQINARRSPNWQKPGRSSMAWCTPSPLRRVSRLPVTFSRDRAAKPSGLHTTSRRTA